MNDRYSDLLDSEDLFGNDWDEADWYEDELDDEEFEDLEDDADFEDAVDDELVALTDAMSGVLDAVTPAEAFNIGKAFSQLGKGASQVVQDPTVRQIAATAAPLAGGAVGTAFGGPVGTAVGSSLGAAAGKALAPSPAPAPPAAPPAPAAAVTPMKPPATGSTAATKALVSTQLPDVLKALCALAAGAGPATAPSGVPTGALMSMVAKQFEQAAADADELFYASDDSFLDPASPADRADALYAALIGRENAYLAEAGLT